MDYFQQNEVHLMVWEENPKKRNVNNKVCLNVKKPHELKSGDRVFTGSPKNPTGAYTVTEVLETRQSSLKDFNYVTTLTEWEKLGFE